MPSPVGPAPPTPTTTTGTPPLWDRPFRAGSVLISPTKPEEGPLGLPEATTVMLMMVLLLLVVTTKIRI
jgi:hypothetical protein